MVDFGLAELVLSKFIKVEITKCKTSLKPCHSYFYSMDKHQSPVMSYYYCNSCKSIAPVGKIACNHVFCTDRENKYGRIIDCVLSVPRSHYVHSFGDKDAGV